LFSNSLLAQNKIKSFFSFPDTINHTRLKTVVIAQSAIWLSSMYGLNKAWYANYPRSRFQFYNDSKEWQHAYSCDANNKAPEVLAAMSPTLNPHSLLNPSSTSITLT